MVSMNDLHELVEAAFCGRKKSLQILVENNGNEPGLERLKLISMPISLSFGNSVCKTIHRNLMELMS